MPEDVRRRAAGSSTRFAFTGRLGPGVLLAGLAVLGCKGKRAPAGPPGVDCATAATAYVGRHTLQLNVGNELKAIAETAIVECNKQPWSQPLRICLRDAQSSAPSDACFTDRAQFVQLLDAVHLRRVKLLSEQPPPAP